MQLQIPEDVTDRLVYIDDPAADSAYMNDVCRDGGEIARAALAATETQP